MRFLSRHSSASQDTVAAPSGPGSSNATTATGEAGAIALPLMDRGRFTELCLRYLLLLRIFTIGGPVVAIIIAYRILALRAPVASLATISLVLTVFTLISWRTIQAHRRISDDMLFVQLAIEILGLTCLLYFIGGADNPFASLLLLPIVLATVMLERRLTWTITLEAAVCYTALMLLPMPAPHWSYDQRNIELHQLGHWVGFLLSAGIIAYFVVRMGDTLRAHTQELAQARERSLRANQMVALGTLAAGTAHELGTPLATVAILAKEVEREVQEFPELAGQLRLLRTQVDRCKEILASMAARAGQVQADAGRALPLICYLEELIAECRNLHPNCRLDTDICTATSEPTIVADRTVSQALLNIMNNAAEVATQRVRISAHWNETNLELEVEDDGQGFAPEIRAHVGTPFVTTKLGGNGLGLGIYLARSTIERIGGHLEFFSAKQQGTRAKIDLPLAQLRA